MCACAVVRYLVDGGQLGQKRGAVVEAGDRDGLEEAAAGGQLHAAEEEHQRALVGGGLELERGLVRVVGVGELLALALVLPHALRLRLAQVRYQQSQEVRGTLVAVACDAAKQVETSCR